MSEVNFSVYTDEQLQALIAYENNSGASAEAVKRLIALRAEMLSAQEEIKNLKVKISIARNLHLIK